MPQDCVEEQDKAVREETGHNRRKKTSTTHVRRRDKQLSIRAVKAAVTMYLETSFREAL
jgi:hypothetical protein